jgi:hypothetical protein
MPPKKTRIRKIDLFTKNDDDTNVINTSKTPRRSSQVIFLAYFYYLFLAYLNIITLFSLGDK